MTMRTTSCSGDQNWSRPIRFEIWIYCLATLYWRRARNIVGPALFAVTRDVFCNYCIPTEQLAVRMVTRPSFSWDWRVWLARLALPICFRINFLLKHSNLIIAAIFLVVYSQKGGFRLAYHQYFLVLARCSPKGGILAPPYTHWICHCLRCVYAPPGVICTSVMFCLLSK